MVSGEAKRQLRKKNSVCGGASPVDPILNYGYFMLQSTQYSLNLGFKLKVSIQRAFLKRVKVAYVISRLCMDSMSKVRTGAREDKVCDTF